jgi:hypothetical protein
MALALTAKWRQPLVDIACSCAAITAKNAIFTVGYKFRMKKTATSAASLNVVGDRGAANKRQLSV